MDLNEQLLWMYQIISLCLWAGGVGGREGKPMEISKWEVVEFMVCLVSLPMRLGAYYSLCLCFQMFPPPKTFILGEKINPSSSWIKAINISQSCFQTVELVEPRKHVLGAFRRSSFAFYEKVTRDFSFLLLITTLSFPLGNNSFYSVKKMSC